MTCLVALGTKGLCLGPWEQLWPSVCVDQRPQCQWQLKLKDNPITAFCSHSHPFLLGVPVSPDQALNWPLGGI